MDVMSYLAVLLLEHPAFTVRQLADHIKNVQAVHTDVVCVDQYLVVELAGVFSFQSKDSVQRRRHLNTYRN